MVGCGPHVTGTQPLGVAAHSHGPAVAPGTPLSLVVSSSPWAAQLPSAELVLLEFRTR